MLALEFLASLGETDRNEPGVGRNGDVQVAGTVGHTDTQRWLAVGSRNASLAVVAAALASRGARIESVAAECGHNGREEE